jgi:DHA2 family methylenomycin A resistance protein-like MFS transporter
MRKQLALLAICLGYLMVIVDVTIVNVALPSISRDLGGGIGGLQWVLDAYTIVFAGLLLSAGSLGDRIGAKRCFNAGLIIFIVASALCALAPSVPALVGARLVQGVGAALLVPSSLSLLRAAYDQPAERARAVGIWGGVAGVGAASGPVLGGLLVGLLGWRAVFVVNLPIGIVGLVLAARYLPNPRGSRAEGFDPRGQVLGILSLTLLTLGLIDGGQEGWSSLMTIIPLVAFICAATAFVAAERTANDAMLPLWLFRSRTFSGASFVGLAINLGFYGQLFAISLYFQQVRGFSALQTGLALLPEGIFVALGAVLSGRVTARAGPRLPMLIGLLCGAAGFAGLTMAGRQTSFGVLVAPLVAAGFGMAFTMPAATAAIIEAAPARRAGIAAGVLNASRQTGGAIGVALLGTLLAGSGLVPGLHVAMTISAAAFLLGAVVTALTVGRAGHDPGVNNMDGHEFRFRQRIQRGPRGFGPRCDAFPARRGA